MLELGFESWDGSAEHSESRIAPGIEQDPAAPVRPATIGRYRILRLIGEGGMGAVYEAEQDSPRRTVALKIIRPAMASPDLLRRFEQESQALGRLQHPGIAQIYEAGTMDLGFGPQPYFAMEFIRGLSPRNHAETHHLTTRERLQMMAKICEGVHHAHQRGLIHRDLKPGNILIDETGQPKILDFGVARVTDSDARATLQTNMGQLIGTLAYMSPEQALADPLDIDTRSDVYSLGVILYELLAGRLPYTVSKKVHEAIQAIREEDPARLSAANRTYRGDIETIVAKALEKDRARRYASAAQMAADIQRYLNDEPIVARPPSSSYQLRKFARRNRSLVAGIAAVFVVLVAGVAAFAWQAAQATRERDHALKAEEQTRQHLERALRAEQAASLDRNRAVTAEEQTRGERDNAVAERQRADTETDTARALNDFLRENLLRIPMTTNIYFGTTLGEPIRPPIIGAPMPNVFVKLNPNLTFREVLDRAAANIAGKFDSRPLVEAGLRESISDSYYSLGVYAEAQSQLERAVELRRRAQGRAHPDTLKALRALLQLNAQALFLTQPELEALLKKIVDIENQTLGKEDPEALKNTDSLAGLYLRDEKFPQAEALLLKLVAVRSRLPGKPDLTSVRSMILLIEAYEKQGKSEQARQLTEKLEAVFRVLGEKNDITQAGLRMLFTFYLDNFPKRPEVETLHNRTLESTLSGISSLSGTEALSAMISLVQEYQQMGKSEQADQLSVIVEARLRALGGNNPMMMIGVINSFKLKTHRSLPDLVDLVNTALPRPETESLRDIATIRQVARAYYDLGKYQEAENLYTRALVVSGRLLSKEDPDSLAVKLVLAGLYVLEGKHDLAEEGFKELLDINRRASGPEARTTLLTTTLLGWSRLHQQRYAEVEVDLREVLRSLEKTQPDEWERYNCQSILGASVAGQKRYADAEPLLLSAYDGMVTKESTVSRAYPLRPKLHEEGGERIVQLYQDWGKPDKAAEWREKLREAEARAAFEPPRK